MAIIVEDGTKVSVANSYLSEVDLIAYADARGVVFTGIESELLIHAMDYIESRNYQGSKSSSDQALVWPRYGVWLDGYSLASDTIPQLLKDALAETCIAIDAGNSPTAAIGRATKREKLDGLEVEYMDNASATVINRSINGKLRKLLVPGGIIRT